MTLRTAVRRPRWLAAAVLLAAAGAVAAVVASSGGGSEDSSAAASQATRTTTVRRQDLVETETVDGTLGYSDSRTVVNRLSGTVTWTPRVGAVIRTNHRLYEVDGEPVYLLDGSYPAYRTLKSGLEGGDVRQFERNLRELGLDGARDMKVDGSWDPGTTAAAKRWQKRKGMEQDGTIEKGRVVFQPGSRRIGELQISAGASAAGGSGGSGDTAGSAETVSFDEGAVATVFAVATQQEGETPATTETTPAPEATTPEATQTTPEEQPADGEDDTGTSQEQAPAEDGAGQQEGRQQEQQQEGQEQQGAGASGATPSSGSAQAQSSSGGAGGGAGTGAGGDASAGSEAAGAGADVSSAMMTTTSTRRIVSVDLAATRQSLADEGDDVSVELPDGSDVEGTLLRVGKVAEKKATSQDEDPPATVELVITLKRSAGTGLDQAPVDVSLEKRRAKDVLTVPVTALLARAGGEFAVEAREGGRRRVVPVETGLYTDSYVEIEGEGLRPGLTVTNAGI